ncbi:MAG: hypothetical protein OQK04_01650, partial [Kangiellaceae bacterium]|nr:hypothetical protein [Kangiellaceae bacterium]
MSKETGSTGTPSSNSANVGLVSGLKIAEITPQKSKEKSLAELRPGDVFDASASFLGKQAVSLSGTIMDDGSEFLSIPFKSTGFTFSEIFSDFKSSQNSGFVFDNVDIHLEKSKDAGSAFTLDFIGNLRIDKQPLKTIADALNIDEAPLLTAQIETADGDLSDKITPQAVTLTSSPTIEVNIIPKVSLTSTNFKVAIEKQKSQWVYQPGASGTLEVADIADEPVSLECEVEYQKEQLKLSATTTEVKDLFDIGGLTLSNFAVDAVLGKDKSLAVAADFKVAGRTYALGGAIDESKTGIYTRDSKFSVKDLSNIVAEIFGGELVVPEFDLSLNNVLIGFANADGKFADETLEKGITLKTEVKVFDYSAELEANFSDEGVELSADMAPFSVGPVKINDAKMVLNLYKSSSKKNPSFEILGETTIEGITVDCKLVYEKQKNKWESVVYAMLNAEGFVFSRIFSKAKGTFVDTLEFSKLGFIYASFNGQSQDKDFQFDVKKGLQLVGDLKQFPALSTLTKKDDLNLILSAYFGTSTEIGIALPDTQLNLGKSVTTSPIKIGIELAPEPSFELVFGLDAKV